ANPVPVTINPPLENRAKASIARLIPPASPTLIGFNSTPNDGAAPWMAPHWPMPEVILGSLITATRVKPGVICLSTSNHFTPMLDSYVVKPVAFPPGRARLSTNPAPTGSGTMSALGQKQTCAVHKLMSALPPKATAKADSRKRPCLLYPRKRTCAVH